MKDGSDFNDDIDSTVSSPFFGTATTSAVLEPPLPRPFTTATLVLLWKAALVGEEACDDDDDDDDDAISRGSDMGRSSST